MILVKPYYEILTHINGEEILRTIEKVARTCYKSEDKISEDSSRKLVQSLIARGHEAMIEFYDITVKFVCDRGVSHEIVRHRLGSYAQESTRYCNYTKDKFENQITFIIPCWLNIQEGEHSYYEYEDRENKNLLIWLEAMYIAEDKYKVLIKNGWSPQQARSILPNSLKTEINVKFNLREWKHFFKLRCSSAAHPQMRELTIPLLNEFKSLIPIIFDDIDV
jgi:thymidylate synthase (FAD)